MTVLTVVALAGLAVVAAAPAVRVVDRKAGWPLAALFLIAAILLLRRLPEIIHDQPLEYAHVWAKDFLAPGVDVVFALRADALSSFFALLALLIGTVVFIYSAAYLPRKKGNTSFYLIMTAFTLSILLLVLANDVVLLFIAWELVSIASFLLIARSGSGGEAGSMRTLVLTFVGGLTLLAALAIAATQTGTTNVQEMLASPVWGDDPQLTAWVAILVAVSAFTKSAQLPFHFWLPEAMAAATPVSAFLHAAAVVKAGVYLLIRFSTIFHDVPAWNWLLIVVGMTTAVMSAAFAVQKTDLKKLTAYSTVSHLGWIVATIGVGTPFALAAALVHTLAHALFKSSLFMLIGVVDHQAGTRDIRRLGVLYNKMPFTFGSMVVGAASMAAVPPLMGFVSKEGMLSAFMEAPINDVGVIFLVCGAAVGALLTFTYSWKLVFGAFIDGRRPMTGIKEAPISLWLPAAIPGLLSIPVAFFVPFLDEPIEAAVLATGQNEHVHLAIWHGFNLPFAISVAVLILGVLVIRKRKKIWPIVETRAFFPRSGNDLLTMLRERSEKLGRILAQMANSHAPERHLVFPFLLIIILGVATAVFPGVDGVAMAPRVPGIDHAIDLVPLGIIMASIAGLTHTRNRVTAVVLLGTIGVGVSLQMLLLGAPDVAMTQFLVEALVVVIIMLVVRHQRDFFPPVRQKQRRRSAAVAIGIGVVTFLGVWGMLGRHERSDIAMWYLNEAPEISGGANVVNTILVEFRAFDTLGELSVLGMAGVVIAAVLFTVPRRPFEKGTHPAPFGQSRLNAIPLRTLVGALVPILIILSVTIFLRGHNDPGGGFIAALVAGGALMLSYLSQGQDDRVVPRNVPFILTGVGMLTALFSGVLGLWHGSFLYPIHGHIGDEHLSTSMIFDVGVYLAVLGMLTLGINALGGYLRPGNEEFSLNERGVGPLTPWLKPKVEHPTDEDYPMPLNPARDHGSGAESARGVESARGAGSVSAKEEQR